MLNVTVHLLLAIIVQFWFLRLLATGERAPCLYSPENLSIAYKDCSKLVYRTSFVLTLNHGAVPQLEADMKNAFTSYCSHVLDINACVLSRFVSQTCDRRISELYLSMVSKSNSFCSVAGELKNDVEDLFTVSKVIDLTVIDHCKPSQFDFNLCRRLANSVRNQQNSAETANQETEYLLELSLCLYSSVFVGCPTDTAILTLMYEIDEWLPPRLGANTTEVLKRLFSRRPTFY